MIRFLFVLMVSAGFAASAAAESSAPQALPPERELEILVPQARAILDAWHASKPVPDARTLHLVLWTPADREPAPRHRERLCAMMRHIQAYYAREMERLGFGPRSFALDTADDGLTRVHLVRGRRPYADYDVRSGGQIRTECLPALRAAGIEPDRETIVLFCNMSVWNEQEETIRQNSPYYAGGSHRSGTAWQVDSPLLDIDLLDRNEPLVRDGQYGRISVGRYNSIFIGGVAHELGHALGLPHNRERPDERALWGTALMGSGNRTYGEELRGEGMGSFLTLAHGLRLASHPLFSRSAKGLDLPATARPEDLRFTADERGFVVTGRVQAEPPVYGVVAYLDPAGGSDYDATTATAVPDEDGRFTLFCHALAAGKPAELRLFFLQAHGAASGAMSSTPFRFPYEVDAAGRVDLSAIQAARAFKPLAEILGKSPRDLDAAAALVEAGFEGDPDGRLRDIARRLVHSFRPLAEPDPEALANAEAVPLSNLPAASQRVGWGRPARDRLPDENMPLAAGSRLFGHGFYAHAPARHEWSLDGSWSRLRGHAGLAAGRAGSVRFRIEGDGTTLWQSDTLRGDNPPAAYDIALAGVKQLVLTVDDAGDGNASDWGLWLEPTLLREP